MSVCWWLCRFRSGWFHWARRPDVLPDDDDQERAQSRGASTDCRQGNRGSGRRWRWQAVHIGVRACHLAGARLSIHLPHTHLDVASCYCCSCCCCCKLLLLSATSHKNAISVIKSRPTRDPGSGQLSWQCACQMSPSCSCYKIYKLTMCVRVCVCHEVHVSDTL